MITKELIDEINDLARKQRSMGLTDEENNWCGGRDRLLQMGDILDRGPYSRKVDDLLDRIR